MVNKMKIYSIHSQLGNVGKTKLSIYLAKYFSENKKEKTCLIDMDPNSNNLPFKNFIRMKSDFSSYLLECNDEKKKEKLENMIIKYTKNKKNNLFFIGYCFDLFKNKELYKQLYLKTINEDYTEGISTDLKDILKYLRKNYFENVIIDNQSGWNSISKSLLKNINSIPIILIDDNILDIINSNISFKQSFVLYLEYLGIEINNSIMIFSEKIKKSKKVMFEDKIPKNYIRIFNKMFKRIK